MNAPAVSGSFRTNRQTVGLVPGSRRLMFAAAPPSIGTVVRCDSDLPDGEAPSSGIGGSIIGAVFCGVTLGFGALVVATFLQRGVDLVETDDYLPVIALLGALLGAVLGFVAFAGTGSQCFYVGEEGFVLFDQRALAVHGRIVLFRDVQRVDERRTSRRRRGASWVEHEVQFTGAAGSLVTIGYRTNSNDAYAAAAAHDARAAFESFRRRAG